MQVENQNALAGLAEISKMKNNGGERRGALPCRRAHRRQSEQILRRLHLADE